MRYSRLTDTQANCETPKMFQFIRELNRIYDDENKDTDSQRRHLNVNDMPVYKGFEFLDNYDQELKGFKEEDGVVRNQGEAEGLVDPSHRAAGSPTSESEESKGRKKIYVKKDVEDYDKPETEMVAFFEDSNYYLVKDIIINNESVCQDGSLIEDYKLGRYDLSSILDNDDVESTDSIEETLERLSSIANELELIEKDEQHLFKRFSTEDEDEDEISDALIDCPAETIHLIKHAYKNKQHNSKRLMMEDGDDFDGRPDNSAEKILYTSYKRLTMEDDEEDFDGRVDNHNKKILPTFHQIKENLYIPSKESALSDSLSSSTSTESEHYNCATSDACRKSAKKSTNSNTDQAAASIQGAGQVPETEKPESGLSSESSKTSSINQDYDEDSSSDPPSGPIEHSGSIPSSGSIRLSNSTTSTCSFAFPILATECPGSPVRMANADKQLWSPPMPIAKRKQLQKRWCWKLLVCCTSIKEER